MLMKINLSDFEWITIGMAFIMWASIINYQYRRLWYLKKMREEKIYFIKCQEDKNKKL